MIWNEPTEDYAVIADDVVAKHKLEAVRCGRRLGDEQRLSDYRDWTALKCTVAPASVEGDHRVAAREAASNASDAHR
jgi:hypothetical protein